jgi:hypothetical protein
VAILQLFNLQMALLGGGDVLNYHQLKISLHNRGDVMMRVILGGSGFRHLFAPFTIALSLLGVTSPSPSQAQTCGTDYTIKEGETLAQIAARVYGNPAQWTIIFYANQDRLGTNVSLLVPGSGCPASAERSSRHSRCRRLPRRQPRRRRQARPPSSSPRWYGASSFSPPTASRPTPDARSKAVACSRR